MTSPDPAGPGSFRSLLRRSRMDRGLTQERLAEASNVSVVSVSALERGTRRPYRETVERLAEALGLAGSERAEFERAAFRERRPTGPAREAPAAETQPSAARVHEVPTAITRLFGREQELADLTRALERHRLVTLTGPGGIGKTRLAAEFARASAERFVDGTYFIDFAPIADPRRAVATVASALGIRDVAEDRLLAAVLALLRRSRNLLVFDNCEQIVQAAAELAAAILTNCPQVSIVATSRERLRIDGEFQHRVPPLSFDAIDGPAVALFLERAAAVVAIDTLDGEDVRTLCRRLDGIPLALELAAARLDGVPLRRLMAGLDARFRVMTGGNRAGPARHQRLEATLDWSYDLLSDAERAAFRASGVFSGGFRSEAFVAVCAGGTAADTWSAWDDLLASLVNKSLVMVSESGTADTRYYLLETMRAYALEKVARAGDDVARRHAAWVAELTGSAYERYWIEPRRSWFATIAPEADNARAALTWALDESGDARLGGRIASALGPFWTAAGLRGEGRAWIAKVFARANAEETRIIARAWLSLAQLSVAKASVDAAERALAFYEPAGASPDLAIALYSRAYGLIQMGNPAEALDDIDRCIELWRSIGTCRDWPYAAALETRGTILADLGRTDEARALLREALSLYRNTGDDFRAAGARLNLAELVASAGDTAEAFALTEEAIAPIRRMRVTNLEAIALVNAAGYHLVLGDAEAAAAPARDALDVARAAQMHSLVTVAIQHLATVASLRGEAPVAAQLMGYVDAWYEREDYAREPTEQRTYDVLRDSLSRQLSAEFIGVLCGEGRDLSEDAAADRAATIGSPAWR